jgi:hypothetical protein
LTPMRTSGAAAETELKSLSAAAGTPIGRYTHTHTHTQRERERERERLNSRHSLPPPTHALAASTRESV